MWISMWQAVKGFFLLIIIFSQILHLKGDRKDFDFVKSSLSAKGFDVVYDINGMSSLISALFF